MNATAPPATERLTQDLKDTIQSAYRAWLESRGFKARRGQREMIACVARTLTAEEERIAVIEAGTGTGKTFAYLAPVLSRGVRTVVSTGTKTLQDQLFKRDLPAVLEALSIEPRVALLKGRSNYLCQRQPSAKPQ